MKSSQGKEMKSSQGNENNRKEAMEGPIVYFVCTPMNVHFEYS